MVLLLFIWSLNLYNFYFNTLKAPLTTSAGFKAPVVSTLNIYLSFFCEIYTKLSISAIDGSIFSIEKNILKLIWYFCNMIY